MNSTDEYNLENDYVILNNDIEPDNELLQIPELKQPLTQAETWLVDSITMSVCLAPTDLKSRLRTLPHIIDTFHKNFQKLKSEAKNDSDRIQNEIFELYNSFFLLAKSILLRMENTESLLKSSEEALQKLVTESSQPHKDLIDQLFKNSMKFKSVFEELSNPNQVQVIKNKLDLANFDKDFIDRVEKLKSEFSVMHPSPANSLSISEWAKYAHLLKVGTKLIMPLWHVSYVLFFGVAFGASLVGMSEYFSYYKNHNGFMYLNACLSELYALQEISIVMSSFVHSITRSTSCAFDELALKEIIIRRQELIDNGNHQIDLILLNARKHASEMLEVVNNLKQIDLKTYIM